MIRSRWWALAGALLLTAPIARAQNCSGHCDRCPAQRKCAIDSQLQMPLSIDYRAMPLSDFLEHLHDLTGLTIEVDQAALQKAGIDLDQPVTMKTESATLELVLNLLQRAYHVVSLVDADGVHITTAAALGVPSGDGCATDGVVQTSCQESGCYSSKADKGKCCCPEGTKCDGECTPDNCTCTKGEPKPAAPCCDVPGCSKCCPCEGGKCGDDCCEPAKCPCKSACAACCPVCACLHKFCACMMGGCVGKMMEKVAGESSKGSACAAPICVPEACGMPCPCPQPCVGYPPMPMAMPPCAMPCGYAEAAPMPAPENWKISKNADGISIHGPDVDGTCDGMTLGGPEGCVVLEGHVKLKWDHNGQHTEVKGDHVCVRLADMAFWVGGAGPMAPAPEMMKVWFPGPMPPRP